MAEKLDINEVLAIRQLSPDQFESISPPAPIGAFTPRAYGGVTSAMALNAAWQTVPQGQHIYSLQGNYLGPALIDRVLQLSVRRVRDTRSFATRMVEASQLLDSGERRVCLVATADFMAQEPVTALPYTEKPRRQWSSVADSAPMAERMAPAVRAGKVSPGLVDVTQKSISLIESHFDIRHCRDSVMGDTMHGAASWLPTRDDGKAIADVISGDWLRAKPAQLAGVQTQRNHAAAMACALDMATGFLAAFHNKQGLRDYGTTSSLEFSLRFFSNSLKFDKWHLREMQARVGAEGRSFHEIRLWNGDEQLIAVMTQQAIIRPKPAKKQKKSTGAKI